MVKRFDVYLVSLDPESSTDPKNTRPGVVISPDEANLHLPTVLVAPLSSTRAGYPTRVPVEFLNDSRFVILDQIRSIDNKRLVKKIGEIDTAAQKVLLDRLAEYFAN
ncbi:MAG: type II toxin-antitoxin system PemK/MazF family toxin [Acidobacteriota bacterium]